MKLTEIYLAEDRSQVVPHFAPQEAVAAVEALPFGTLALFEPDTAPRAVVVLFPGGGFNKVNADQEGGAAAVWFVEQGLAAAVVKYRLPEGDPERPLQDARKAMDTVRSRFPNLRCGVFGASIGGYLAAGVALADKPVERPDFQVLFYPVVSMEEGFAHRPSMLRLFGHEIQGLDAKRRSPLLRIDRSAPEAFVAAAADDAAVTPLNACRYAETLLAAGVGVSFHLYASGGHGFGFRPDFPWHDVLVHELEKWLNTRL